MQQHILSNTNCLGKAHDKIYVFNLIGNLKETKNKKGNVLFKSPSDVLMPTIMFHKQSAPKINLREVVKLFSYIFNIICFFLQNPKVTKRKCLSLSFSFFPP